MTFLEILPYVQIVFGILSIILILLQRSEAGLGGAFGGADSFAGSGERSRRGGEKTMFYLTLFIVFIFVTSVLSTIFIEQRLAINTNTVVDGSVENKENNVDTPQVQFIPENPIIIPENT